MRIIQTGNFRRILYGDKRKNRRFSHTGEEIPLQFSRGFAVSYQDTPQKQKQLFLFAVCVGTAHDFGRDTTKKTFVFLSARRFQARAGS